MSYYRMPHVLFEGVDFLDFHKEQNDICGEKLIKLGIAKHKCVKHRWYAAKHYMRILKIYFLRSQRMSMARVRRLSCYWQSSKNKMYTFPFFSLAVPIGISNLACLTIVCLVVNQFACVFLFCIIRNLFYVFDLMLHPSRILSCSSLLVYTIQKITSMYGSSWILHPASHPFILS